MNRREEIEAWLYGGGPRSAHDVKRDLLHLLTRLDAVETLLADVDDWPESGFTEAAVRFLVGEIRCAIGGEGA